MKTVRKEWSAEEFYREIPVVEIEEKDYLNYQRVLLVQGLKSL